MQLCSQACLRVCALLASAAAGWQLPLFPDPGRPLDPSAPCPAGGAQSGGPIATARDIYRRAGMKGFMRGWSASYMRLGPQTLVMFMAAEKLRALTGMDSL